MKTGVFLASEFAGMAGPVMADLEPLLSHPEDWVRFYVVESVLTSATSEHGQTVAKAGRVAESVRWLLGSASADPKRVIEMIDDDDAIIRDSRRRPHAEGSFRVARACSSVGRRGGQLVRAR